MLVNSVLMIVISVFDNSEQRFENILMTVNHVLKIVQCLPRSKQSSLNVLMRECRVGLVRLA